MDKIRFARYWVTDSNWEMMPRKLKIFRAADRASDPTAHMEFSYGLSSDGSLRWSWNSVGNAFANENTQVTPSGPGLGNRDCNRVRCEKNNKACTDGDRNSVKPHVSNDWRSSVDGSLLIR